MASVFLDTVGSSPSIKLALFFRATFDFVNIGTTAVPPQNGTRPCPRNRLGPARAPSDSSPERDVGGIASRSFAGAEAVAPPLPCDAPDHRGGDSRSSLRRRLEPSGTPVNRTRLGR